jgi:hypothetical protein
MRKRRSKARARYATKIGKRRKRSTTKQKRRKKEDKAENSEKPEEEDIFKEEKAEDDLFLQALDKNKDKWKEMTTKYMGEKKSRGRKARRRVQTIFDSDEDEEADEKESNDKEALFG